MRQLTARLLPVIVALAVLEPHARAIPAACPDGRNPVTEVGARFQISQTTLTATLNNPFLLSHESPTKPVRYLRARITAKTLGSGSWYVTVRDLRGHPLQTFSRQDFVVSDDRWTARIPGAVAAIELLLVGNATSPELTVTEYVAMPERATNPYYSVMKPGREEFHPLYPPDSSANQGFRSWGDLTGFVMGSWGDRLWGCSGVVVGPGLFLTAWHCGGAGTDVMPESAFWSQSVCRDLLIDLSWDDDRSSRDFGCVKVVDRNKERDFALLEMTPIASGGEARPAIINLRALDAAGDTPLVLIHHPLYMQKQITRDCKVSNWKVEGWALKTPGIDFSHDCDTEGGSSGAPVFNSDGQLIGLHHFGHAIDPVTCAETDRVNKAVRLDAIVNFLDDNKNANGRVVDKLTIIR